MRKDAEPGFDIQSQTGTRSRRSLSNGQASRLTTLKWQRIIDDNGGIEMFMARQYTVPQRAQSIPGEVANPYFSLLVMGQI